MSPKAVLFGKCGQRSKSIPPWGTFSLAWGVEACHGNLEREWMPCVSPFRMMWPVVEEISRKCNLAKSRQLFWLYLVSRREFSRVGSRM